MKAYSISYNNVITFVFPFRGSDLINEPFLSGLPARILTVLSHGAGCSFGSGAGADVAPCSAPVGSVTPLARQHSRVRVGAGKKEDLHL